MPHSMPNFYNPVFFFLALLLAACFTSRQVAARHLQQMNLLDTSPQLGQPAMASPSLNKPPASLAFPAFHKPLLPPHFLPLYPFPSLPTYPSLPTIPSQPSPTGPSIPSLPAGSFPGVGVPSGVPPSYFSNPPGKMIPQNPSTLTPRNNETLNP